MGFPELPQPIQDQIDTLTADGPGHPMDSLESLLKVARRAPTPTNIGLAHNLL